MSEEFSEWRVNVKVIANRYTDTEAVKSRDEKHVFQHLHLHVFLYGWLYQSSSLCVSLSLSLCPSLRFSLISRFFPASILAIVRDPCGSSAFVCSSWLVLQWSSTTTFVATSDATLTIGNTPEYTVRMKARHGNPQDTL